VHKSNRKGELFYCLDCGYDSDSDYNASLNHEQFLPDPPIWLRYLKLNRKGFYWLPDGFFDLDSQELRVLDA
jgi:hypothetical protein